MFVASNFLFSLAKILHIIFTVFYWLILIRALISWVNPDPSNAIVRFLFVVTEPVLYPIRKLFLSRFHIGVDISPIIAFLIIKFLGYFVVSSLLEAADRLR
ncbi:MAG: YggT family protein [Omnitrophica bacterium]|nr:YggT family protein [Candidatus Omnitrophota bacterium]